MCCDILWVFIGNVCARSALKILIIICVTSHVAWCCEENMDLIHAIKENIFRQNAIKKPVSHVWVWQKAVKKPVNRFPFWRNVWRKRLKNAVNEIPHPLVTRVLRPPKNEDIDSDEDDDISKKSYLKKIEKIFRSIGRWLST